jgi:hypothetical protein
VRHCEKFISLHEALKQPKRTTRSSTLSEGDEGGHGTTPASSVPLVKRDQPLGWKQAKSREGEDNYMDL